MKATIINGSALQTCIAIWVRMQQAPPDLPIAWISAQLAPESYAVFDWEVVYEFIWANTGKLVSGKIVHVADRVDAAAASVMLEKAGESYRLVASPPEASAPAGTMTILTASNIPMAELAVGLNIRISSGIGQPGNGVSVLQAQPNLMFQWTPGESYFANFGAIAQSQYDPHVFQTQAPLALDFAMQDEIAVMLTGTNTLVQLNDSEAKEIIRRGGFAVG